MLFEDFFRLPSIQAYLDPYENLLWYDTRLPAYQAELSRDPDYGPKFVDEFQDRLLYGTDLCGPEMALPMIGLLLEWRETKKITEEVFQKVARENAIKLLALE